MQQARLDQLCEHLDRADFAMHVSLRLRIATVFGQIDATDRDTVHGVLTALVVQQHTDAARFDAAFDAWWASAVPVEVERATVDASPQATVGPPWWLLVVAILSCLVPLFVQPDQVKPIADQGVITPDAGIGGAGGAGGGDPQLAESYMGWEPRVVAAESTSDRPWDAALIVFALGALGYIRRVSQQRHPLDTPAVVWDDDVPPPAPMRAPTLDPEVPRFVAGDDRNALVWGIDRFTSGEERREIDVDASIAATLDNGGAPTLIHERERHHRVAWLWIDDTAKRKWPELEATANEIAAALRRVGLTVELARFGGAPLQLRAEDGERFTPEQVAERAHASRVVIFTDGDALQRRVVRAKDATVQRILRELARWPALTFADFARGGRGLAKLLGEYDLNCISPEEIPVWLGGERGAKRVDFDDLGLWAAACALSPDPVSIADAHLLRDVLSKVGLAAPPWGISRLPDAQSAFAGRLRWTPDDASAGINWLYGAEAGDQSLFATAWRWWRARFSADPSLSEADQQHRAAHRAILDLWQADRVEQGAATLHPLRGVLTEAQRTRLRWCCPSDHAAQARASGKAPIELHWAWADLSPATREQLRALEFGAQFLDFEANDLRRASRLWIAAGLAMGMLLVGVIGFVTRGGAPDGPPTCPDPLPADAICDITGDIVWAGDRRAPSSIKAEPGTRVLRAAVKQPCRVDLADGSELWRCGTIPSPVRPDDARWPRRSVGYISKGAISEGDAAKLLDAGAFDVLVRAGDDQAAMRAAIGPLAENDQLLQFGGTFLYDGVETEVRRGWWADVPADLAKHGGAVVPTREAFEADHIVSGAPVFLAGGGCPRLERTFDGVEYVRVCAGEFEMGSESGDDDEKPVRTVSMKQFWIGKYEVTNAQYRARISKDHQAKEDPQWPVSNVNWAEAKAFCETVGGRLPTEAEWEYAARGSDGRTYPWGNAAPSEDLAVFEPEGKSVKEPQKVGSRPKGVGPFGTHDQAGNLWEWVGDCYVDTYENAGRSHPLVDKPECERRVLRGGAFYSRAQDLRSAGRFGLGPGYRRRYFGFRCVRGPRPEP